MTSDGDSELYEVILQNMADGVCLVRASDGTVVYANPRMEELFGYVRGELVGMPVGSLVAGDESRTPDEVVRACIDDFERRGQTTYEVETRRRDGSTFWSRARVVAFDHPQHGRVWVTVLIDVSAEKSATERLERQERLLRAVVESLPVGLWLTDATGRIVRGNEAGKRIWAGARYVGVEQYGEYQGWWADTGKPIAPHEWALARAIEKGETSVGELVRIRCFDGTYKTMLNSATPIREEGAIVGAIVVNEDVTRMVEAEARYSSVVAAAPDAIIALDAELRITVFNAGAERIFGHAAADALGQDVAILVPAEESPSLHAMLRRAETTEAHQPAPFTARRRDGSAFPVEVSVAAAGPGGIKSHTCVFRDVTARVRAEEERSRLLRALEEERTWLRTLIDAAPMGIVTIDAAGKTSANRRAEELLGAEIPIEKVGAERALRGERVTAHEVALGPSVAPRWVSTSAAPARDDEGRSLGAIAMFDDITPRKRLEDDLRHIAVASRLLAESLDYESTLMRVASSIVPALADGCVVYLVGEDGEVFPAVVNCSDPDVERATQESLQRYPVTGARQGAGKVVVTGEPELMTTIPPEAWDRIARDPGHLALLRRMDLTSYLTVPLEVRSEKIGALTFFDVGTERRLDRHDLFIAEEIARRAAQAIDNARAYGAAQQATKTRDEMLAVVAHDLRSPLNTILGLTSTLVERLSDASPTVNRSVAVMQRAAQHMNRLIADLLDVARVEGGNLRLSRARVVASTIIDDALALARPLAGTIELEASVPGALPDLDADHDRVVQVLSNLVGNALKFTPPGGRITVSAKVDDGFVRFAVRDTGAGIPAEQVAHVFDRFWQGKRADRRGAGLGLAIARGLVEAHGGRIWLESTVGAGTTVSFTIPVHADAFAGQASHAPVIH